MRIVTVFGGSGFIGRYAVRKLAKRGWRVRVATRRPGQAAFLRPYGDVGQVEPVQANLRNEASVRRAIEGSDAVINFVGILFESGKQGFDAVQAEGAETIARMAAECGVASIVHISAIGADAGSGVDYQRTKGEGEAAMRRHMPQATILRPSIVFGPEDQFFNMFASMARYAPVLPVIGGDTQFQPVYVDDVAEAAVRALDAPEARGQTFELGGPEVETMRALMARMLHEIRRNRFLLPVPDAIARIQAWVFELPNRLLGVKPLLTRDQVRMLESDNIVGSNAKSLQDLGVKPTSMASVLPTYLYRHRPYGQYAELRETR